MELGYIVLIIFVVVGLIIGRNIIEKEENNDN